MERGSLCDDDLFRPGDHCRESHSARPESRQVVPTGFVFLSKSHTQKLSDSPLQDAQLWDVKAKQLNSWVDRGLINVKLLDRTLAYFQNQTSYLQYIKTLKRPVPKIESPGFPGTQWSEYYWKDQTVMLLMLETDFPDGKNPDFCASLFREEPGVWKLKMEQFKRFVWSYLNRYNSISIQMAGER